MAKVFGMPRHLRVPIQRSQRLPTEQIIASSVVNGGMVTVIDQADIGEHQSPLIRNGRVRHDRTSRRIGRGDLVSAANPNSNPVRDLFDVRFSRSFLYVRVTDTNIHTGDRDTWKLVDGGFSGSPASPINHSIVLGTIVLVNGVDRIKKLDVEKNTLTDLGTKAPRAKVVTGFGERVVAANISSDAQGSEIVAWSGNRNFSEWDTLVDQSAGQLRLDTSSTTTVDPIRGLFGFTSVMIIVRESSIWLATLQPIASNPFNFFRAVPGIGADSPKTIARTKDSVVFLDTNSSMVYQYRPGMQLAEQMEIGREIRPDLEQAIDDALLNFAVYSDATDEYYLGIGQTTGGVFQSKLFVYNFITKAWTIEDFGGLSSIGTVRLLSNYTSYDDLVGTYDELEGTYDSLSTSPKVSRTVTFGFTTGNVLVEDGTLDRDDGATYEFERRSKEFKFDRYDIVVNQISIEYQATKVGSVTLEYSKNSGTTWTKLRDVSLVVGGVNLIKHRKQIRARRLMWRIRASSGLFDILNFEVRAQGGGDQK